MKQLHHSCTQKKKNNKQKATEKDIKAEKIFSLLSCKVDPTKLYL